MLAATSGTNGDGHGADVAGGKTPAYAVTSNPNGTVTLAVYKKSGIAGANAKLHELGDSQVYVVPVEAGCPSISSLPAPAVPRTASTSAFSPAGRLAARSQSTRRASQPGTSSWWASRQP